MTSPDELYHKELYFYLIIYSIIVLRITFLVYIMYTFFRSVPENYVTIMYETAYNYFIAYLTL